MILYFSGTGNTKFIARKIGVELEERGHSATPASVEKLKPTEVGSYELLVFGYPIYGYDMPDFLNDYLEQMSLPSSRNAAVYYTMGYDGGNSLRTTAERLTALGFNVVGTAEFKMPGNDGLAIMDKDSETVHKVLNTDYEESPDIVERVKDLVDQIEGGNNQNGDERDSVLPQKHILYRFLTPITKFLFKLFERGFTGRFRADDSCIGCGLCERICPADNITVRAGKVEFGDDCYFCLRCLHQCPVEAIQITRFTEGKFRYRGPTGDYVPAPLEQNREAKNR